MARRSATASMYRTRTKQWRWRIRSKNGKVIGASSESYIRRAACLQNLRMLLNVPLEIDPVAKAGAGLEWKLSEYCRSSSEPFHVVRAVREGLGTKIFLDDFELRGVLSVETNQIRVNEPLSISFKIATMSSVKWVPEV